MAINLNNLHTPIILFFLCLILIVIARPISAIEVSTSITVTVCGNNIQESGEFCDMGNNNKTYVSGTQQQYCNTTCSGWAPSCGDQILQAPFGEICDSSNEVCEIDGYAGTKTCNSLCNDWLACQPTEYCGDNIINGQEICDNNTRSCTQNGYTGTQSCQADCSGWNNCATPQNCGDSIISGNEICDNNTESCTINGYAGTKTCNQTCSGFDSCQTSEFCGDQIKNGNEECDGTSSCSATCQIQNNTQGGQGSATYETKVIIIGKAYPFSTVTLLKDGRIATVTKADSNANFIGEITNITPGLWTFGLWALDTQNHKSITHSFTASINPNMITTISGIFLPPTIELDKINVKKGGTISIMGQTAPDSNIDIIVNPIDPGINPKTKADINGIWLYKLNTSTLKEGAYSARARSTSSDGLLSNFSQSMAFYVGKQKNICARTSDINLDKRINLVDFSILLYNWKNIKNNNADINCDNKVNLVDFSIMMYNWTG